MASVLACDSVAARVHQSEPVRFPHRRCRDRPSDHGGDPGGGDAKPASEPAAEKPSPRSRPRRAPRKRAAAAACRRLATFRRCGDSGQATAISAAQEGGGVSGNRRAATLPVSFFRPTIRGRRPRATGDDPRLPSRRSPHRWANRRNRGVPRLPRSSLPRVSPSSPRGEWRPVRAAGDLVRLPVVRYSLVRQPRLWCRRRGERDPPPRGRAAGGNGRDAHLAGALWTTDSSAPVQGSSVRRSGSRRRRWTGCR